MRLFAKLRMNKLLVKIRLLLFVKLLSKIIFKNIVKLLLPYFVDFLSKLSNLLFEVFSITPLPFVDFIENPLKERSFFGACHILTQDKVSDEATLYRRLQFCPAKVLQLISQSKFFVVFPN